MIDREGSVRESGKLKPGPGTDFSFHQLVLESADIKGFLTELAILAAAQLSTPGSTIHSGVTVLRLKRPEAVAASDAAAQALGELQNGFGDGPSLTALRNQTTVLVADLAAETRWQGYVRTALRHGVSSILCVPLDLAGGGEAVFNLYSGRSNGFSGEDIGVAEMLAGQAASSLRLILRITQPREAKEDLSAATESRTVIDMAIGAIMAENSCTRATAFGILTRASSARNLKLREMAAAVIASIPGEQTITAHFKE